CGLAGVPRRLAGLLTALRCSPDIAFGTGGGLRELSGKFLVGPGPRCRVDRPEPRFLPEEQAARLAAAVRFAVAAMLEVNAMRELEAPETADGVAGLVCTLVDLEPSATIFEHLRHER